MANITVQAKMYDALKRVYPKALRECEMYDVALRGTSYTQRDSKMGGTYMRTLVKKGLAKRVTTGYYVAVAPFQQIGVNKVA